MTNIHNYSIKQVSELSGLPESTLRYYETIGLITPVGRDPHSKHRTYSEDDLNMIVAIACLNSAGMSIEEMKTYLKNRHGGVKSAREQVKLLESHKKRLDQEADFLRLRQQYIDIKLAYWQAVISKNKKEIESIGKQAIAISKKLQKTRR